jgi:hypothetical protein
MTDLADFTELCSRCGENPRRRDRRICQRCHSADVRRWLAAHPERRAQYRAEKSGDGLRDKQALMEAYGGRCVCCGETELAFLTLDHVGGVVPDDHCRITADGRRHRIGSANLYHKIKAEGFPQDKYRCLCFNCNAARSWGRTCPHELARENAA